MREKVAIVGGGLTGLTAAMRLSQKGYKLTVFEKRKKVGGLAAGCELAGMGLEETYHHIFKTDENLIGLIFELGLGKKLGWYESSIGQFYQGKVYPFVTPKDLLRFKPLGLIDKVRMGLVYVYLQRLGDYKRLVRVGADEWMKKWAGEKSCQVVWRPLMRGKFHQYYKEVSMAWLWARINSRGKSKDKEEGGERLGYLEGGFGQLSEKLAERIKEGEGKVRLETEVKGIAEKRGKFEVESLEGRQIFDKVISCVPGQVLADLIKMTGKKAKEYKKKLKKIDYLGFVNVIFSSKQSLSDYYWHNVTDLESPFLAFIQHTNLIDKSNYKGKHIYYLGTYVPQNSKYLKMDDNKVVDEFLTYLLKLYPEFDRKRVGNVACFRFNWAQHVASKNYEKKILDYRTAWPGLYLANFSQIFPNDRGMNFAVIEGEKIAKLIG